MFERIKIFIVLLFIITVFINCRGGPMPEEKIQLPSINSVPASAWDKLSRKTIYFGHQSVGFNIMDGLSDVMKENPTIKLKIIETFELNSSSTGVFAHSRVGENVNPKSKIDSFIKYNEAGIGNNADISFFKFCYVDLHTKTDVESLFNEYKKSIARLVDQFPNTKFVHVTVPLTAEPRGIKKPVKAIKGFLKKVLGKRETYDNTVKKEFNDLLRKEYKGKKILFDLAEVESTRQNGSRSSFTKNDKRLYSLVHEYTDDGGHLNRLGRKVAAEQLLIFLSTL